jgi:hypothetical protein
MRICFIYRWQNPIMAQVRELFKLESKALALGNHPAKLKFGLHD